ncbi:MAG: Holliday junction resolvase RuvX [Flavobacteriales bacterium]|nr:Holliday junction resolvase RuvX [Flavobacteriales bacterium]
MGKALGIDYGLKKTGLSISDNDHKIAFSLCTVRTNDLNKYLDDLIKKEKIDFIVVGYPINLDGKITDLTNHVNGFIKRLITNFPNIPVNKFDERFTSKIAKQTIVSSGINKKK